MFETSTLRSINRFQILVIAASSTSSFNDQVISRELISAWCSIDRCCDAVTTLGLTGSMRVPCTLNLTTFQVEMFALGTGDRDLRKAPVQTQELSAVSESESVEERSSKTSPLTFTFATGERRVFTLMAVHDTLFSTMEVEQNNVSAAVWSLKRMRLRKGLPATKLSSGSSTGNFPIPNRLPKDINPLTRRKQSRDLALKSLLK